MVWETLFGHAGFDTKSQSHGADGGRGAVYALDGGGLLTLIAKRTPEQQQELLEVAYQGEY